MAEWDGRTNVREGQKNPCCQYVLMITMKVDLDSKFSILKSDYRSKAKELRMAHYLTIVRGRKDWFMSACDFEIH